MLKLRILWRSKGLRKWLLMTILKMAMGASFAFGENLWKKQALFKVMIGLEYVSDGKSFVVFGAYLPPRLHEGPHSIVILEEINHRMEGPMLMVGDFNTMLSSGNKTISILFVDSCMNFIQFLHASTWLKPQIGITTMSGPTMENVMQPFIVKWIGVLWITMV